MNEDFNKRSIVNKKNSEIILAIGKSAKVKLKNTKNTKNTKNSFAKLPKL